MHKTKGFFSEFKEFLSRGNVMDLAIGLIIGSAFTAIVTSLNNDIISPLLGLFGGVDFSNLMVKLGANAHSPVIKYGNFLTAVINFLITGLVLFIIIKIASHAANKLPLIGDEEPAEATTKTCPYCKSEIDITATRCPHCTSQLGEHTAA
jgi:large conductance mechanosensitive channel